MIYRATNRTCKLSNSRRWRSIIDDMVTLAMNANEHQRVR